MDSGFRDTASSRTAAILALGAALVFGVGIGLAVTAIASPNSASALATMASFLLGGVVALGAYFGREFLITRNVTRALLQEIDNAHAQCKDHLSKSDYEKAKKDILADETYIPYIGWQPVPHELYKKAIEELFLLTGDLIAVVQKAYDSEVTIEIMVTKLEGPVFAGMKQSRRASFLDHVHNAIIEDEQNLEEARDALTRHQILSRFFFG